MLWLVWFLNKKGKKKGGGEEISLPKNEDRRPIDQEPFEGIRCCVRNQTSGLEFQIKYFAVAGTADTVYQEINATLRETFLKHLVSRCGAEALGRTLSEKRVATFDFAGTGVFDAGRKWPNNASLLEHFGYKPAELLTAVAFCARIYAKADPSTTPLTIRDPDSLGWRKWNIYAFAKKLSHCEFDLWKDLAMNGLRYDGGIICLDTDSSMIVIPDGIKQNSWRSPYAPVRLGERI